MQANRAVYVQVKRQKSPKARLYALFSYLGILCLIPLIFNREDEYVHFHARQGLVLWIWGVLAIFSLYIPILGGFIFSMSVFAITALGLLGVLSVLFTRSWKLPVIGMIAARL